MYLIYLDLLFSKARQIQNTKNLSLNLMNYILITSIKVLFVRIRDFIRQALDVFAICY